MTHKISRKIVALSSSAIAAVYLAGYVATQRADTTLAAGETPTPLAAPAPASTATPGFTLVQPGRFAGAPTPTAPSVPTGQPAASGYRDGTYQGHGTSRRGGVGVAVTVQGGRITNVAFTDVTTQYPVSRIAALPGQVLARQSAQVDRISGATFSVQAFQQAVQQALAQAIAPRTGGA